MHPPAGRFLLQRIAKSRLASAQKRSHQTEAAQSCEGLLFKVLRTPLTLANAAHNGGGHSFSRTLDLIGRWRSVKSEADHFRSVCGHATSDNCCDAANKGSLRKTRSPDGFDQSLLRTERKSTADVWLQLDDTPTNKHTSKVKAKIGLKTGFCLLRRQHP